MALLEMWERFELQFLENISDGFIAFDRHWNVISVNTKGCRLLFCNREDLIGKSIYERFPAYNESAFYKKLHAAWESNKEVNFAEYASELQTWFEVKAFPTPEGLAVLFRNVTEQRQKETVEKQYYRSLFLQHPDAVYAMDLEGNYRTVNPSTERIIGYSRAELQNRNFRSHVFSEDLPKVVHYFEEAARGTAQRFEARILKKNGEPVDLLITHVPIIVDGAIVGVYGIAKDITKQKETEQALRLSEKALAQSHQIAGIGYWEVDFQARVSKWSEETFRIFGLEPAQGPVSLEWILAQVHPEDRERVKQELQKAENGYPLRLEYRIIRSDGEERVVRSQRELAHYQPESRKMFGVIQDVTEQKRTEQLLIESQKRYQSLMTYNSDGVAAMNLDGSYLEVNPAFERMTGYKREELQQMTYRQLVRPEEAEQTSVIWDTLVREAVPFTISQQLLHKNGQSFEVNTHNIPIIVGDEVTGYFTISRDTSQQKRMDEILRQSDKLAAVGQLAAAVAHEVRNPLTSLKGFTQLLQHEFPDANQSYFDIMKGELERIELISGELLVLAKPKPERFELRSVNQVLHEVVTLLESQANMSNVEVVLSLEPTLPPIFCDENQLKQVFVNIMKNGIEAMQDGGKLTISTRRHHHHLFIAFQDEGCGISKEKLERIGEPFFTTKEKGTGLGMMITQKIVQHHKGTLEVESQQGKGTTVKVSLPIDGM